MNTWIKRGAWALGLLAVAATTAVAAGWWSAERKIHRQIQTRPHPLSIQREARVLARGQYLFESRGCAECHGNQGQGRVVIQDDTGMLVKAPSIAPHPQAVVATYTTIDWERTIRHGVKPSGSPLMIMPSEDYNRLTDQDVAALIAYTESLAPQPAAAAVVQLPLPVKVLYGLGMIPDAAQRINHDLPPPTPVAEGVTPVHGQYVAQMCVGCHGPHLSGGKIPGAPPDWPAAANLTPGDGSTMPQYAQASAFVAMLRTGKRPDGSPVSKVMPFETLAHLNDTDAQALHAYLLTLAPVPAGQR